MLPGDPAASIPALTERTGRQRVPPAWALQPQLDRLVYVADTPAGYQAKVADDLDHIAAGDVPLSGYRIEGWADLSATDLAADIARLHALHVHALEYFRAYVGVDSGNTEPSGDLAEALAGGYLATTAGGAPYLFGTSFGGVAGVLDVTNPSARAWFAGRLVTAMDSGADGFMTDFGEQVQPDMHFADGATGATEHNRFPVEYQQIVHDTVTRYEATHPGRQIFWYDRAGWQGSAAGVCQLPR